MRSPHTLTLFFLLLLCFVSGSLYYSKKQAVIVHQVQLAAALASPEVPPLGARTKTSGCVRQGALPDPACTPGAIFKDATVAKICVPGYTKTVRSVSTKMRQTVYAEYGDHYPVPRGNYEVDHLIPLALGGDNDISNLFAEPAEPVPGFKEKDLVEVYLQGEVCAGRVELSGAQRAIAHDWLSIYLTLSPETIAQLKAKYHSWAN